MRKIVVCSRVSLDGYFAGPNGELHEWAVTDPNVDAAWHELMNPDTILFGRVTYQQFEDFWPKVEKNPDSPKELRKLADELSEMTKVVFSRTLKEVTWENSKLIKDNLVGEVKKLKQGDGADITIFGSGTIVQQLADEGLVDEYLLAITPIVLGEGKSFFKDVHQFEVELLEERDFKSGNVVLHYRTAK